MGREVRRVPPDWQHPKDAKGRYIPLFDGSVSQAIADWDAEAAQWAKGDRRSFEEDGPAFVPIEDEYKHLSFEEWHGARPRPEDYMPDWPDDARTHWQMYENTTEGTPISPVMPSPEALARWLAEHEAPGPNLSAATYDQWLAIIREGYAPSFIGVLRADADGWQFQT